MRGAARRPLRELRNPATRVREVLPGVRASRRRGNCRPAARRVSPRPSPFTIGRGLDHNPGVGPDPEHGREALGLGADELFDDLASLGEDVDLAIPLVHADANMVYSWPLPLCGANREMLLRGRVCHHVKREASRFIPSILMVPALRCPPGRRSWAGARVVAVDGQQARAHRPPTHVQRRFIGRRPGN